MGTLGGEHQEFWQREWGAPHRRRSGSLQGSLQSAISFAAVTGGSASQEKGVGDKCLASHGFGSQGAPQVCGPSHGSRCYTATHSKGKGRANRTPKAPPELVGLAFTGQCCYSYNKGGCSKVPCPHPHICARCGQTHPLHKCPQSQ
eukprot:2867065-Amphidinium_carterae.2